MNPFSGCLLLIIQIPIIFALYYVFLKGMNFESGMLYPFIHTPAHMNMIFLGVVDISKKSLVLAILAGVSQSLQAHFMPKPTSSKSGSFQESFSKSMNMQMKYVFPFIIALIAYGFAGAVSLYWITNNLFAVGQQIYINKKEFTPVEKK